LSAEQHILWTNRNKQTNLLRTQSRRETIGQVLRLIRAAQFSTASPLNTRYPRPALWTQGTHPVLCRRPEALLCLTSHRPLTRAAEHLHYWQQHGYQF
jgi:hypothetical protein